VTLLQDATGRVARSGHGTPGERTGLGDDQLRPGRDAGRLQPAERNHFSFTVGRRLRNH
jgi:hypothetical protein